jgi:hypothetical protein
MTPLTIEEIQAILHFLQGYCIFLRPVLQDKLFKVQECALMRNFLPDLDKSFPSVFCGQSGTVGTLSVLNQIFDFKYLL